MLEKKKILFAIADRDTEDYLSTIIKEDCKNCYVIGTVTYKEKLIQKVNQLEPDILILRETLPGALNITDILFELRYSYSNVRIIFLGGDRNPGDPLLLTLVAYGVYDLLVGGNHKIADIISLINKPNNFRDVNHLIPKASLDEFTNTIVFESPLDISRNRNNIVTPQSSNIKLTNDKKQDGLQIQKFEDTDDFLDIDIDFDMNDNKEDTDDFLDIDFDMNDNKKDTDDFLDIDIDFDMNDNKEDTDDFLDIDFDMSDNKEDTDDFLDIDFDMSDNKEDTDDFLDIDFDMNDNKESADDFVDINNEMNGNKDILLEDDDDFLLDIDIADIKDNKDKKINDILHEIEDEENDDIVLLDTTQKNKINDDLVPKKRLNKKNNKYKVENNTPSLKSNTENSEYDDLEILSKEIEQMKDNSLNGINTINKINLNNLETYNSEKIEESNKENESLSFKSIINKNRNKSNVSTSSRQKIISFIGGKNGIGTSTIAVNTAVNLAKQGNKVIYIEMNTVHPTVGYWYQIGYINQGIETAIKAVENGETQSIDKSIIKSKELKQEKKKIYKSLPDTLDFLLFSKQETILKNKRAEQMNSELLKDLFLLLMIELNYDYVILDLDFDLNNKYTTTALSFSNLIYSIVTQDISTLAYLVFKIEELERLGKNIKSKSRYIVNKYESSGVQITLRDLKEWLDSKKITVIPENNKEFINANASSMPITIYTKNEKIIKAFGDISKDILSNELKK